MQAFTNWVIVAIAVLAALGAVAIAQRALTRWSKDHWTPAGAIATRCIRPAYAVAGLVGVTASLRDELIWEPIRALTTRGIDLALIASVTWLVIGVLHVLTQTLEGEIAAENGTASSKAREMRTQMMLIRRVITALGLVVGGSVMLFQFEAVRAIGSAALASAGIAGIVAGIAARETLGNLFAGFQVAFSELVTVDDVVEVEGEWGQVEEVTLQFVVIRIWDERRLIIPVSYFVQTPFRNWTSKDERIIGTIFLYLDWRVPIEELRTELSSIVNGHPLWDGQVAGVLVTDVTPEGLVEVRITVSSADGFAVWDLRCEVRERLVTYVRENYPGALPRHRVRLDRETELVTTEPEATERAGTSEERTDQAPGQANSG